MEVEISGAPPFDNHKVSIPLSEIRVLISCAEVSLQKDPTNAGWKLYLAFLKDWEQLPRDPERDNTNLHKVSYVEYVVKGVTAGGTHAILHELIQSVLS